MARVRAFKTATMTISYVGNEPVSIDDSGRGPERVHSSPSAFPHCTCPTSVRTGRSSLFSTVQHRDVFLIDHGSSLSGGGLSVHLRSRGSTSDWRGIIIFQLRIHNRNRARCL